MKLGDAFTMRIAPRFIPHLYLVISDPDKHAGNLIVVNITGDRFRTGKECILNIGDHEWITKPSFVSFGDAIETSVSKLSKMASQKKIKPQPSLSSTILEKIVKAA